MTTLIIFYILYYLALGVATRRIMDHIEPTQWWEGLLAIALWPVVLLGVALVISVAYPREKP